jgi:hypothetical protein
MIACIFILIAGSRFVASRCLSFCDCWKGIPVLTASAAHVNMCLRTFFIARQTFSDGGKDLGGSIMWVEV